MNIYTKGKREGIVQFKSQNEIRADHKKETLEEYKQLQERLNKLRKQSNEVERQKALV